MSSGGQTVDPLATGGRGSDRRCVREQHDLGPRCLNVRSFSSTRSHLLAATRNARPASITRRAILLSSAVNSGARIDRQDGDVGAIDRLGCAEEAVVLDAAHALSARMPAVSHEPDLTEVRPRHHRVDAVTRGSGGLGHDASLLAQRDG